MTTARALHDVSEGRSLRFRGARRYKADVAKDGVGKPGASSATVPAILGAFTMIAGQVASKATRDALFLAAFGADKLPVAMLASSVLSVFGVVAMSKGLAVAGPRRLVPILHGLGGLLFGVEYFLFDTFPRLMAGAIYLHVAVLGSLFVSGFWSLVSEHFDPHTAKRVVSRISAGATMGGLAGGIIAERVSAWLDARTMLLVLTTLGLVTAASVHGMTRGPGRRTDVPPTSILQGMGMLGQARYLRMLAMLVMLTAMTSGLLDYAFKAQASESFGTREELLSFFGLFYTVSGLLTFLLQAGLSRVALERLGIGGTIALLPALVALGGGVATAVSRLWTVVVVRGIESVLANSLYRSGYELLFTPLSAETKRPTKTFIDVGFDRLGGALASGIVLAVLAAVPAVAARLSLGVATAAATLSVLIAVWLHRGYVAELAQSLKSGRVRLEEAEVVDATTRRTLADTTMAIDRNKLLQQIEELRGSQSGAPDKASTSPLPVPEAGLRKGLEALLEGEPHQVRRVLRPPLAPELVGLVLPLLVHDGVGRAARRALRHSVGGCLGQLVDALCNEELDVEIRRKLPEIIATVNDARASLGLFNALSSSSPEVRSRASAALDELLRRSPELRPRRSEVFAAVARGLDAADVSLPQLFAMLAVVLEREPLELSLHALRSDDDQLRGTSFEYLDIVLPEGLRERLFPHLEAFARRRAPSARPSRRTTTELAEELRRSTDEVELDPELLKKINAGSTD